MNLSKTLFKFALNVLILFMVQNYTASKVSASEPVHSISGFTVDAILDNLGGVEVSIFRKINSDLILISSTKSDSVSGKFTFSDIPRLKMGNTEGASYCIMAKREPSSFTFGQEGCLGFHSLTEDLSGLLVISDIIIKGNVFISSPTKQNVGVFRAKVIVYNMFGFVIARTTTDADGKFSLPVYTDPFNEITILVSTRDNGFWRHTVRPYFKGYEFDFERKLNN